jgi:hypothetical protein
MKVNEIVSAALAKLDAVQMGAAPTADQMASGVRAFNAMISGWVLDGINLWLDHPSPLSDFQGRGPQDESGVPAAFVEGAIYCLASRLAPEYEKQIAWDEGAYKRRMQAALVKMPAMTVERTMLRTPNNPDYRWRI